MNLARLRLVGFKSFVDPTDVVIEPGLTGVVGPNGCGKSNLVEALRWAMGETSFKAMRASGMDDVIFSGSFARPARNHAEVALVLDNTARRAPALFNDNDTLEVTRRIERETGSSYRVNGREARARDVQLLFADASTGARSPALVRQGQIGELISAKPEARRSILEEAAGISGLHSRRHEAEIRLKGAETNLERVEDVLGEIRAQLDGLRRQARQTARYRSLSAEIRRTEALLLLRRHAQAVELLRAAESTVGEDRAQVRDQTEAAAGAAKTRAVAAYGLPAARDAARLAGERLAGVASARMALDIEERRAGERVADLERQTAQIEQDIAREDTLAREADEARGRLRAEHIAAATDRSTETPALAAEAARTEAERRLGEAQTAHAEALAALRAADANRAALHRRRDDELARLARSQSEIDALAAERRRLDAALDAAPDLAAALAEVAAAESAFAEAEGRAAVAEQDLRRARELEGAARGPLTTAERMVNERGTELRTLRKMLAGVATRFAPVLGAVTVAPGYETALGAVLGEDLDASEDVEASAHWRGVAPLGDDPALPEDVVPLTDFVRAPTVLDRRLRQIGVVAWDRGAALQPFLAPGQRLVSREGDVWRWDGLTVAADAPTPAAKRLAERNRLNGLETRLGEARFALEAARRSFDAAEGEVRRAAGADEAARREGRERQEELARARETSARHERAGAEARAQLAALATAERPAHETRTEAAASLDAAERALAALPPQANLAGEAETRRNELDAALRSVETARAEAERLRREAALALARVESLDREIAAHEKRLVSASAQAATLRTRLAEIGAERERLAETPARVREARLELLGAIEQAESERARTADALARAESAQAEADRAGTGAERELAHAREALARSEARVEAATERVAGSEKAIADAFECSPADLPRNVGLAAESAGDPAELEPTLDRLKRDRERLGAVNLLAEDEERELTGRHDALEGERVDLAEAVSRLRGAIQELNREGRERLVAAFEVVNGHFGSLFATLFGGGAAELQLTDLADPLGAGLDILARPPGKKPQTLTLLSGGEQALTTLALIFAVFLTNPAPICVLDEVDAPLDDANVERFCDLLDEMRRRTDTRFLVITHNPITMARMERLYGVTMVEAGVSQLVSVDLETAERFREAG